MEMSRDKVRSILNRDSWYANLPSSLQEQLLDIGVLRQFEMAVLATSKHGDEATQINLQPEQWFGKSEHATAAINPLVDWPI